MEEYDYASVNDGPSRTNKQPATETPSPAVQQEQVEGERSQLATVFSVDAFIWSVCQLPDTTFCSLFEPPGLFEDGEVE